MEYGNVGERAVTPEAIQDTVTRRRDQLGGQFVTVCVGVVGQHAGSRDVQVVLLFVVNRSLPQTVWNSASGGLSGAGDGDEPLCGQGGGDQKRGVASPVASMSAADARSEIFLRVRARVRLWCGCGRTVQSARGSTWWRPRCRRVMHHLNSHSCCGRRIRLNGRIVERN